ncbi:MAG: DUF1592 domain-containing protein [Pirellulales bacterium]
MFPSFVRRRASSLLAALLFIGLPTIAYAQAADDAARNTQLDAAFRQEIRPLLEKYCHECHADSHVEADIDLAAFKSLADVRKHAKAWQKVGDMLDSAQMPPKDSKQPTSDEQARMQKWVRTVLTIEAAARAGDPGPVVMRRLSNSEYTYTLRDLTGVPTLDPAREFPVDSAAGEGFTNVGAALVMSPALLTKYLDASKGVAEHLVLLPDGVKFSQHTTRRDWTNEYLDEIRSFYGRYAASGGGSHVNLQGIQFETNQGGRMPLERYLEATIVDREPLASGQASFADVAARRGLSAKYLESFWKLLSSPAKGDEPLTLDPIRTRWKTAQAADVPQLAAQFGRWQSALWKFNSIGHIGATSSVKSWMEPVSPLVARQEMKLKLPATVDGRDVVVTLAAHDAGDGNASDFVVWERPRLVAPGRPDVLLRDVRRIASELGRRRERQFAQAAACLEGAVEASAGDGQVDVAALAAKHKVDVESLTAWLDFLGIGASGNVQINSYLTRKMESASGYEFVKGWVGDDALSIIANSSDQHVRIPGNMKPHSVAVHPSPTLSIVVGWKSPVRAAVKIAGSVQHAHPECGNGTAWSVELRRGNTRQRLAAGVTQGAAVLPIGPLDNVAVQPGDLISLVINPRDNNHSCDLTAIDLTIADGTSTWSLSRELSSDLLAGNPHADGQGRGGVWHFYSEPAAGGGTGRVIPAGSLLARWQAAGKLDEKRQLASDLQKLLQAGPKALAPESADAALYRQLTSLSGPFMTTALQAIAADQGADAPAGDAAMGLDPKLFGKHPRGGGIDPGSLCVQAPRTLEIRLPAELVAGAELATTGYLHVETGREGTVQLQAVLGDRSAVKDAAAPIVAPEQGPARERLERELASFRQWFPPALCYTKIVPVDEVVTLTLYYREDEPYRRLMLSDAEAAQLDRLWTEMLYVAREPLETLVAFEQISEFATQDRPDMVEAFKPLRKPVLDRAAAFKLSLVAHEPQQLSALLSLASRIYRRPATDAEVQQLRGLYASLRSQELPHDEALRLVLARMLVSPAFLYKSETPGVGTKATPVSDFELATRLSYFLWSSQPDQELLQVAGEGKLRDPDVLVAQMRRLLADAKTRRLATEFACHWLHIYDFDHLNEKSERHFPTFAELRGAMYEESILFFTDMFQANRSLLNVVDADYTYLNEPLAKHYGIPGVTGAEWRRVEGVRQHQRGGVLTQATTLSKQAGASRTSPILRGNWLSEVVMGEKLPKPPKNVPQLAETAPEGLTERQMIELHSTDPACAKCHARIDPFGFALESYDAIGRFRLKDAAGLPINTKTALPDGTQIEGLEGLRKYLLGARREALVRQFCRKLLGYSLGRSVQLSDEPLLAEMQAALKADDYKVVAALEAVVRSRQFREIRGRDAATDEE